MRLPAPNINTLWADLLIEQLVRGGVRCFVLTPGSRCAPLAAAVAHRADVEVMVHYDERGSAYAALGHARATGQPAAWITTSGTALANGYPAVVEAAQSGVPLILLTADRPPELRGTGANQTIDQVKFFGDYVRWFVDLPCPTTEIAPAMVLMTAAQALYACRRAPAGPVHLNCMFREPLAPGADGRDYTDYLEPLSDWLADSALYGECALPEVTARPDVLERVAGTLEGKERGVLVAGELNTVAEARAAARLAVHLGWPLLPDITSGLRLGAQAEGCIAYPDLLLAGESFAAGHAPETVLHIGGALTSKRLLHFLRDAPVRDYVQVRAGPRRHDPFHDVTLGVESNVPAFCRALIEASPSRTPLPWTKAWRDAAGVAEGILNEMLDGADELSEPAVARLISKHIREGHGLFLAGSMPIRDMNTYGVQSGGEAPRLWANRGASGIDGSVATAFGCAAGSGGPLTALLGDLALLHDLNSLGLTSAVSQPVVFVVLNNHGGGIFHFLPIAEHGDIFERFFAAPHAFSFCAAAEMFGLGYAQPDTPAEFTAAYREAVAAGESALIEVVTDRARNLDLHRAIEKGVAAALGR